jgi:hypothetical protein
MVMSRRLFIFPVDLSGMAVMIFEMNVWPVYHQGT